MTNPVLVVGSVALDTIETPSQKVEDCVGGSATYFALACSLFSPTRVVAVVGADFSAAQWSVFKRKGIDARGIKKEKGPTFRWHGRYSEGLRSRETLHLALNVFSNFRPQLPSSYVQTPYFFLANIDPSLQDKVLSQAKGARLIGMDTIDHWIRTKREELVLTLSRVDALIVNDEEILLLTEEEGYLGAARRVHEWGPRILVVKRGDAGSILFVKGETPFFAPAVLLDHAVDPTGAGDTFAGAFMGRLAAVNRVDLRALRDAVLTGSAAASFAVEDLGIHRLASVKAADVERRKKAIRLMSKS